MCAKWVALAWLCVSTLAGGCNCGMPDGDYWGFVEDHPDPTHFRLCNSGEPQYIDPALTTSTTGLPLIYAMWDGLTRHDMNGLPEPSVATSWDVSPDQRTFTFHLRHDARWSNGRPLTADDFAFGIIRILHWSSASANTDPHWKLKNGEQFTGNKIRVVLRDTGPFHPGDVVEVTSPGKDKEYSSNELRYSNDFQSSKTLELRDFPGFWDGWCPEGAACRLKEPYRSIPPHTTVNLVNRKDDAKGATWAYVYWQEDQGIYGWVPMADLDLHPHADFVYTVRQVAPNRVPGKELTVEELEQADQVPLAEAKVAAGDVMMLPEAVGVRVPDPYTFVLETDQPLPYMIAQTPQRSYRPTPREAVARWPQKWSQPEHIITSGAFTMTAWRIRNYIELVKSPTYWDAKNVKLDRMTVFSMNDQAASSNYYFQGGCDAVVNAAIPGAYIPLLDGSMRGGRPYKDFREAPYLGIYFYLINNEKITNVHFRRALSLAIDRSVFPAILHGGQTPSAQLMPGQKIADLSDSDLKACGVTRDHPGVASVMISGKLCYVPPPGLDFDLKKARQELALARKEMGKDYMQSFSLKFNSGVEQHKVIAEYIQQQWKKNLGLDVSLEVQEWKTFLADTRYGNYEVARMGWILNFPDAEAEILPAFRKDSPDNRSKYNSPEYERLMKEAAQTFDRKKRLELIYEAEKTVVNDVPVIPLYVYTQKQLNKPYVKGVAINLSNQVPYERVWIDPDWKQHLSAAKPTEGGN